MDAVRNPFRPGAGRRPPLLAGRDPLLRSFTTTQRRADELGEGDRSWILTGLRGVGKTVLLNELLGRVQHSAWITAKVECGVSDPLPTILTRALVRGLRTATGRLPESRLRRVLGVVKAFSLRIDPDGNVGFGLDVDAASGVADSGRLSDDLTDVFEHLGEAARAEGIGVLLLIDELQEASTSELIALNTAMHHLGQAAEPLPLVLIGAGLPSLPSQLADATSYAERLYDYRTVGLLDGEAARDALVLPTAERGVAWTTSAIDTAIETAGGYPYFLQSIGKHVWDNARRSPIDDDDVAVGLADARREVDDGLYRSRWERATPGQKELLRALADVGHDEAGPVSEIASTMGRPRTSDISVARNELIKKGLVYAPERGFLAFTVPGMHDFITRQP